MKKLTLLLSGIFSCICSFAQTPQFVPADYQLITPSMFSYGECVGLGNSFVFTNVNTLWITNGNVNGTTALKQFSSDTLRPVNLTNFNGKIYFFADDGIHGSELWATDGTPGGTMLVKDINPGAGNSCGSISANISKPWPMQVFNNKIYFAANDGVHGFELWSSDGTEQGTVMFQDLYTGSTDGIPNPRQILTAGNKLFFVGETPAPTYASLYATDGTLGGTTIGYDSFAATINETMIPYNNKVIFSSGICGINTFISDGTEAGTFIIAPNKQNARDIAILNNKAYFFIAQAIGQTPISFMETDGTIAGTQIVYDTLGGTLGNFILSKVNFIQEWNGQLYFSGAKAGITGLWRSDGTTAGTALLSDLGTYTNPYHITHFNGKLLFKADNGFKHDLWYTDGTSTGTQMYSVPGTGVNEASIFTSRRYYKYPMISTGNALYFYNTYDSSLKTRIYKLNQFPESIGSEPEISSIDIYPNPSQGFITVDAEEAKSIIIHSIDGRLVYRSEHITATKHTVDTHNFAAGTYSITTLLSDGTKRYGKFVKQ